MSLRHIWLLAAFIVSFFAVGVPYWQIPYSSVAVPTSLIAPGMFVVGFSTFVLRSFAVSSFWKSTAVLGAAMPAAVWARVQYETSADPTSHNLWPFEIIIALMIGVACSLTGAIIGKLLRALAYRFGRGDE